MDLEWNRWFLLLGFCCFEEMAFVGWSIGLHAFNPYVL